MTGILGKVAVTSVCFISVVAQVSARELLVGSWGLHSVRRYDLETNQFLGNLVEPRSGGLGTPDGMDFGPDGHLYVSSSDSNAVLRFNGSDGTFMGEFATERLNMPGNMQFGPDGFLYVANKALGEVVRFDPQTGDLVDVFATGGGLQQPVGLLWDDGMLYVSDFSGNAIRRYDAATGAPIDTFANVATPLILNLDADGDLLVSSHQDNMIWEYDTATGSRLGPALSGGGVICPVGHLFDGDELIVASWGNSRLLRFEADGDFVELIGIVSRNNDLLLRPVPEPVGAAMVTAVVMIAALARRRYGLRYI